MVDAILHAHGIRTLLVNCFIAYALRDLSLGNIYWRNRKCWVNRYGTSHAYRNAVSLLTALIGKNLAKGSDVQPFLTGGLGHLFRILHDILKFSLSPLPQSEILVNPIVIGLNENVITLIQEAIPQLPFDTDI